MKNLIILPIQNLRDTVDIEEILKKQEPMNRPKIQDQLLETARELCGRLVQSREIVEIEELRNRYQVLKETIEDLIKEGEEFINELTNEE